MASREISSDQAALADLLALLGIDGPPAREKQVADFIRQRGLELGVGHTQVHTPSEVIRLDEFFKACRVASALICGDKR